MRLMRLSKASSSSPSPSQLPSSTQSSISWQSAFLRDVNISYPSSSTRMNLGVEKFMWLLLRHELLGSVVVLMSWSLIEKKLLPFLHPVKCFFRLVGFTSRNFLAFERTPLLALTLFCSNPFSRWSLLFCVCLGHWCWVDLSCEGGNSRTGGSH